jgi:hypothetical protein
VLPLLDVGQNRNRFLNSGFQPMRQILTCVAACLILLPPLTARAEGAARACDLAAASPYDRSRPGDIPGVATLDPKVALPACTAALSADPQNTRLQFEMARVFQALKDDAKARAPSRPLL